ncbi:MAG: ATP-binding protein [Clostridiales Family XIII bacterium]|jgi:predicted AAA+ superfamily ATPase|nr:ATP-binding protein [Clostridiales Family XIII bacterium]
MLKRKTWERIKLWKSMANKMGLLVTGARQVGKTYLIREFAKEHYRNCVEINLADNKRAAEAFAAAENAAELFRLITIYADVEMIRGETLIFIDEVQKCKEVVTAIKFLVEQTGYHYVLSGSLLGIELKDLRSAPVGYLDIVEMFPLDFEEFCDAKNVDRELLADTADAFLSRKEVPAALNDRLLGMFHEYLIVGGMPAAVDAYIGSNNLQQVRLIQNNIIALNKWDISQYASGRELKIKRVYDLIPAELNKQNKRFLLSDMDKKARFREYEDSLVWLTEAGVAIPVYCVESPVYPLMMSSATNLFKLFLSDVGLLTGIFIKDTSIEILTKNPFVNYGSIYENVVAQELHASGVVPYYYRSKRYGELDFVIEMPDGKVFPIEVKSGKDYKRHNALNNILGIPDYRIEEAFVLHDGNLEKDGRVTYLPVYMAGLLTIR